MLEEEQFIVLSLKYHFPIICALFYVYREVNGIHILCREGPPPKANYTCTSNTSVGSSSVDTLPKGPPLMSSTMILDQDHEATFSGNVPLPPTSAIPSVANERVRQLAGQKRPHRHLHLKESARRRRNRDYPEQNAITDILFVCSLDKVPSGYTVVS